MLKYVTTKTASNWGESFIKELDRVSRIAAQLDRTPKLSLKSLQPLCTGATTRLLVFNSDGGLIPFVALPFMAKPSRRVTEVLSKLAKDPCNKIYVLSGRDRSTLTQWFGNLKVGLVAEHGFFICHENPSDPNGWQTQENECDFSWKQIVRPIFQYFTDRTPGSFYEEKETSITWHYRSAEKEFGYFRAMELKSHLDKSTFHAYVGLGEKTIEVRPYQCNYTTVLKKLMNQHPDFSVLLYIGDATNLDCADDKRIITCGVGNKNQKYYLNEPEEVLALLALLAESNLASSTQ
jgi:trehalose 6-phosphate synthase/phosphatase